MAEKNAGEMTGKKSGKKSGGTNRGKKHGEQTWRKTHICFKNNGITIELEHGINRLH